MLVLVPPPNLYHNIVKVYNGILLSKIFLRVLKTFQSFPTCKLFQLLGFFSPENPQDFDLSIYGTSHDPPSSSYSDVCLSHVGSLEARAVFHSSLCPRKHLAYHFEHRRLLESICQTGLGNAARSSVLLKELCVLRLPWMGRGEASDVVRDRTMVDQLMGA